MKRFSVAAATIGLTLSLTACLPGSDSPKASGGGKGGGLNVVNVASILRQASQKSAKVNTVKAEMTIQAKAPQGDTTMHALAAVRLRGKYAMNFNIDQMSTNGKPLPAAQARTQMVMIGTVMYMRSAAFKRQTGKAWIRIPLGRLGKKSGASIEQLTQNRRQADPAEQTKQFTRAKNARQVGQEQIEGVQTTHFTGSLTPAEMVAGLKPAERKLRRKALEATGAKALSFDIWVDAQQLPRKIIIRTDGQYPTSSTVVYRDYDKPIRVVAPPPAQVADFPGL